MDDGESSLIVFGSQRPRGKRTMIKGISRAAFCLLFLVESAHALPRKAVNGACGPANGVAVTTAPTTNLCTAGTATTLSGTGPWAWACTGINRGANASCSAPLQPTVVNGVCGPANGVAV